MKSTGTLSMFRRVGWMGPLLVGVVLAGAGVWVFRRVDDAVAQRLRTELEARVDADARAVRLWYAKEKGLAVTAARDPQVRESVLQVLDLAAAGASEEELQSACAEVAGRVDLCSASVDSGFDTLLVSDASGRDLAWSWLVRPEGVRPLRAGDTVARALTGEVAVGPPILAPSGDGDDAPPFTRVFASVPVRGDDGKVAGVLTFGADPRRELLPLLEPARAGDTGESFAFDADALMLSHSRFDEQLRKTGLIGESLASSAAFTVELRDPGGDLVAGFTPGLARRSLPLTRMAGDATSGKDGVDVVGYRSYRGIAVVGAWRWMDDLGMGVATEMECDEAYAPLNVLMRAFIVLAGLVGIALAFAALVARRNAVLLKKGRAAERQLKHLGQYTLLKKIGEGGMGEVYFARHAMLKRPTAVKLLRPDRTSEQAIARFEREVQQTSRLTHPNTVQIFDFGRTPGGLFYYAMEYLVGVSLDEFVEKEGPLPEGRVIFILKQVCQSLNEAHGLGLIHRDIKPENIALCSAGGAFDVVKVLDFGLVMDLRSGETAKLSMAGTITGTPLWMSPEALTKPDQVDARSDLYSLGAVGYFLLTGKPVFDGETVMDLFNQHMREKPVPPSERVDKAFLPDLEQVILACLEKDPDRRPKNANAFARELDWCRSAGEWNRDKARYWWSENEERMEKMYGVSSKEPSAPSGPRATISIELKDRVE